MGDKPTIDPTSTYVPEDDESEEESGTLELTGLVRRLTRDLISSSTHDDEYEEDEDLDEDEDGDEEPPVGSA